MATSHLVWGKNRLIVISFQSWNRSKKSAACMTNMPKACASIAIYTMLTIYSRPLRPRPNRVSFTAFAGKPVLVDSTVSPSRLSRQGGSNALQVHCLMRKSGTSAIAWQLRSAWAITSMLRTSATTRLGRSVAESTVLTFLIFLLHRSGNRTHPN
jgi:hypothetical protein